MMRLWISVCQSCVFCSGIERFWSNYSHLQTALSMATPEDTNKLPIGGLDSFFTIHLQEMLHVYTVLKQPC